MAAFKPASNIIGINAFLIAIATTVLLLRFISRKLSDAGFWWDDWLVLAAWPFSVAMSAAEIAATWHGFGQHGGDPTFSLHILYFEEILYNTGIALTKLSVLAFFLRIFTYTRILQAAILIVGVLTITWWIALTIASIRQCVPITAYWNLELQASCVQKYPFFLGQAIPNIALDFVLLLLPLGPLWRLNMRLSRKLTVMAIFVVGYFNPVVSILRIVCVVKLGNMTREDMNYKFTALSLWSATEVAIAIFSCSIPSLTHLFRQFFGPANSKQGKQPRHLRNKQYGTVHQRRNEWGQDGGFEGPRNDLSHVDNMGLSTMHCVTSVTVGPIKETDLDLYGLNEIVVRKDIDVECNRATAL